MASFKDAEGRTWSVVVTLATIDQVRSEMGVDILADPAAIADLAQDIRLTCNALWLCCAEEAGTRGLTDKDFGAGLVGDAIEDATNAFLEALVDFFPSRRRKNLRLILEKSESVADKVMDKIETQMEEMDAEEIAAHVLDQIGSGPISGESAEPSE